MTPSERVVESRPRLSSVWVSWLAPSMKAWATFTMPEVEQQGGPWTSSIEYQHPELLAWSRRLSTYLLRIPSKPGLVRIEFCHYPAANTAAALLVHLDLYTARQPSAVPEISISYRIVETNYCIAPLAASTSCCPTATIPAIRKVAQCTPQSDAPSVTVNRSPSIAGDAPTASVNSHHIILKVAQKSRKRKRRKVEGPPCLL
ncbi:hypothetical protein BJ170DRAFT_590149 [Xylariales sp. AK1849]|nr:hypothetical protein BJ170DRAFT_590149 [Xylariales sp. AK1849]